ncbi:hypothetical protein TWF506_010786 [Arthrobotrys conoides]|uniref:Extracellular serine-rich protein n=1 Tax=Arthrobotrys conoides TaxID=74498 RepID=A0AAN8NBJ2_9PEZI
MTTAWEGAGKWRRSKSPISWIQTYDTKAPAGRLVKALARRLRDYLTFLFFYISNITFRPHHKRQTSFTTSLTIFATIFLIFNVQVCRSEVIDILVGQRDGSSQLVFTPEVVYQKVGQQVRFQFYPQNHSVAQSSLDSPCSPLGGEASTAGFFSGFNFVKSVDQQIPTFTINISSAEPIYFYCAQGRHCQSGMVGIINPPNSDTISTFKATASKVPLTQVPLTPPTQDLPSPKFSTTAGVLPGATNGADPQYTPNTPVQKSASTSNGLSTSGYIAVAGVGVLLIGVAAIVAWCVVLRKRQRKQRAERRTAHLERERRRQQQQRGKEASPRSDRHVYRDVDGDAQMIDLEALRVDSSPQIAYAYSFTRPSVTSGQSSGGAGGGLQRHSSMLVQRPISHVSPTTTVPNRRFSANVNTMPVPHMHRSRSSTASSYQHHRLSMPNSQYSHHNSMRISYQGAPSTSHSRQVPSRRHSTMSIPVQQNNRQSILRKPSPSEQTRYEELQKAKAEKKKAENRNSIQPTPSPVPSNGSTPSPHTMPKGKWKIFKKSTYRRRMEVREIDIHDENRHKGSISGASRKPTPSMIIRAASERTGSVSASANGGEGSAGVSMRTGTATTAADTQTSTRGTTSHTADSREMRGGGSIA